MPFSRSTGTPGMGISVRSGLLGAAGSGILKLMVRERDKSVSQVMRVRLLRKFSSREPSCAGACDGSDQAPEEHEMDCGAGARARRVLAHLTSSLPFFRTGSLTGTRPAAPLPGRAASQIPAGSAVTAPASEACPGAGCPALGGGRRVDPARDRLDAQSRGEVSAAASSCLAWRGNQPQLYR